ncbi:CBS domain-containing protein [Pseudonocardia ammonioxydans]|uniref:CBS domain-containing protein n=1 Tax=Pseudonocardia ammonioxydans TaxID=260086 RepID=A0A1I4SGB7_PSUAM|nr:CBS domain-containing protein [Pseudonocardia ammonioxydans]SFM63509.1 CBS domain-containing protein [Pseudonocardia ammonioxydans]
MDTVINQTDTAVDRSVAGAMHTFPKTCGPATTVADARAFFGNPKVHALLVVDKGVLVAVVERADLAGCDERAPAAPAGALGDRVVAPADDLRATWDAMAAAGRRRVAVADDAGRLVGLLCLKRSGRGFCSDAGIQARIDERAAARP